MKISSNLSGSHVAAAVVLDRARKKEQFTTDEDSYNISYLRGEWSIKSTSIFWLIEIKQYIYLKDKCLWLFSLFVVFEIDAYINIKYWVTKIALLGLRFLDNRVRRWSSNSAVVVVVSRHLSSLYKMHCALKAKQSNIAKTLCTNPKHCPVVTLMYPFIPQSVPQLFFTSQ